MEKERHSRRSIRLPQYDYSQPGAYFVTICTHQRQCVFGNIVNGAISLNAWGKIIDDEWQKTAKIHAYVSVDEYVIMPNHLHGILIFENINNDRVLLGQIMNQFKSVTTKRIKKIFSNNELVVWQRNYYEHIIRDQKDLFRIRNYIQNNPMQWEFDHNNPKFL